MPTTTSADTGTTEAAAADTAPELNRAAVVQQALALTDQEALDAVTIRRLATHFGVTPMALYWHVRNKDELLAAMGDAFYEAIPVDELEAETGDWEVRLRHVIDELLRSFRTHPAAAPLAVPRILQCAPGLRLTELTLTLLREAGFDVAHGADIARAALRTAITLVSGLPGAEVGVPAAEREAVLAAKRSAIASLPAGDFPLLRESIDELMGCEDDDAYFDSGADLFLAGVIAVRQREAGRATS